MPSRKRRSSGGSVPAAAAALAGALLAGLAATGTIPWYIPAVPMAVSAAVLRRPWTILALLIFSLVLGGNLLRTALEPRPELGMRDFSTRATLVIDDARISSVPGLNGGTRTVRAKLRRYTAPATGSGCSGKDATVTAVFPAGSAIPPYGAVIEAKATVSPLANADPDDGFAARRRRQGACAIVRIAEWERRGRETGIRSFLADGRDALLVRLFDGVRNVEVRQLAAALYCGVVSGLPTEVRRDFVAAGIIHIFSVSGIHVAVLALCFAFLLRTLPFRVRFPVLTALVWGYVLATGAGTPAVRAGAMVTLWALLRIFLLRLRGIDVLCWTATLMLAVDPGLFAEPGAQYSFLITGALLLLAERRDGRRFRFRTEADFLPEHFVSRRRRVFRRGKTYFKTAVVGAATAFLAGAAVSLRSGNRHLGTGAVAANVLLAALMPGFFALFFIQSAMGMCGAGKVTAPLFEWTFLRLRDFAAFFAENFPDAGAVPPHWSVTLVYLFALFALLAARRKAVRIAAGAVIAVIVCLQLARPYTLPPAVLIHTADHGRPPLAAVADPARRRAVVVNAPGPESARRAVEFLRSRGIREVEVLAASSPGGLARPGAAALKNELKVRQILPSGAGKRVPHGDPCRVTPLKNGFQLDYFDPGSKLYFGVTVTSGDAGYEAVIERGGTRVVRLLPWSIDREEMIYEFTE